MNEMHSLHPHNQTQNARGLADIAGAWVLRRQDGLSDEEETEFRRWLSADSRHQDAFVRLEGTWREMNQPRQRGLADIATMRLAQRRQRRVFRQRLCALGVVGVVAASAWVLGILPLGTPPVAPSVAPIIVLIPDRQTLPDGSTIELNAGADVVVAFSQERRVVRLMRGEALFSVAKDEGRTFVVMAGSVEVRALGTEFSVRHDPSEVDILVTEGRVAVEHVADPGIVRSSSVPLDESKSIILEMGRRVTVPAALPVNAPLRIQIATSGDMAQALAWRGKRIEFTATALSDVLALFNRQNDLQLATFDDETGQIEISGIFWTNDPEGFVRLIEKGLHLKTEHSGKTIVLRRK